MPWRVRRERACATAVKGRSRKSSSRHSFSPPRSMRWRTRPMIWRDPADVVLVPMLPVLILKPIIVKFFCYKTCHLTPPRTTDIASQAVLAIGRRGLRWAHEDGSILGPPGREQVSRFFPGAREIEERCCLLALRGMVPSPTPKRDHGDPQAFRLRSEGLDDDGSGRGT